MTAWADFIQEGSFRGVRFDFVSTRESHSNTLDTQPFPNRDGQRVRPRARNGLRIRVLGIFIEDDYPATMNALVDALDNPAPGELVHPIHGTIRASAENFEVIHDAEDPDTATIDITFIEDTTAQGLVFQDVPSVAGKASEARTAATDTVTNANAFTADTLATLLTTMSNAVALGSLAYATAYNTAQACIAAAQLASTIADELEADGDTMSALEIQARTNTALTALDEQVRAVADYTTTAAHDLGRSLLSAASALGELATVYVSQKPPLVVSVVKADISLLSWCHAVYGDSSRVDEVLALNSFADPLLIPAGTEIRHYAV
jgi:prophage DNA circulation protein